MFPKQSATVSLNNIRLLPLVKEHVFVVCEERPVYFTDTSEGVFVVSASEQN